MAAGNAPCQQAMFMILPRFTLRTILAVTTVAALFFVLIGAGYRGQQWAWGAAIGVLSLAVVALVHASAFGVVWCFAKVATRRSSNSSRPSAATEALP
jgi:hypothetical protein